jgi:hypothetical protein
LNVVGDFSFAILSALVGVGSWLLLKLQHDSRESDRQQPQKSLTHDAVYKIGFVAKADAHSNMLYKSTSVVKHHAG